MRKVVLVVAAVVLVCSAVAVAMERTKDKEEPSEHVATSRGQLDCMFALVIDCNVTLYGEDNIGWPNNVEFYSCVPWTETGGERVYELIVEDLTRITVTLEPISGDPDIWLLGSCDEADCLTVGENDLTYIAVEGGTYYVVVDGHTYNPDCIYDLTVTCEEVSPPPANDTCDGAIDLQEQGLPVFQVDLCDFTNQYDPGPYGCTGYRAIGPEAVYKIDLEDDEWFEVRIESVEWPIDLSLYLITDCEDPVGSCVAGDDSGGAEHFIYEASAAGTYYLMVDSYLNCGGGGLTEVTYFTCAPFDGLVGYYPFSGSAEDHSGYGHDGEVFGATLTADRFGNPNSAYQFDGIDDYIEVDDICPFILTSWTVTAWFKAYNDDLICTIVGKPDNLETGQANFRIGLNDFGGQPNAASGVYPPCTGTNHYLWSDTVAPNEWCFMAYTRDHSSGETRLYVNDYGVVDSEVWLDTACADNQPVWIGNDDFDSGDSEFEGVIDDVRIYTHAITAEEVQALYEAPDPVSVNDELPTRTEIVNCHPNPFNPYTTIDFAVGNQQRVTVAVYDMAGRQVAVLTDQLYAEGLNQVDWDGKDSAGKAVSSGTYLVRLQTQDVVESKKMMLVR